MAKKRVLKEDDVQIWPITRADCVYGLDGETLLSEILEVATDEEVDEVLNNIWS